MNDFFKRRLSAFVILVLCILGPTAGRGETPVPEEAGPGFVRPIGIASDSDSLPQTLSVPTKIAFQGFLKSASGAPVNSPVDLVLGIYSSQSGGPVALWSETQNGVPVTQGVFAIVLGVNTPLSASLFPGPTRYLGVSVNGETELPRIELLASPFAFRAANADVASGVSPGVAVTSLNGLSNAVTLQAGTNVTITPSGNTLTITAAGGGGTDSDWAINGNDMYALPTGKVGVGTNTPAAKLHVSGGTGSVELRLEADTDDNVGGESDQPKIRMTQDNGVTRGEVGFGKGLNDLVMLLDENGDSTSVTIAAANNNVIINADMLVGGDSTHFDSATESFRIRGQKGSWALQVENASTEAATGLYFGDSPTEILYLAKTGRVGIGTAAPSSPLEVAGRIEASGASGGELFLYDGANTLTGWFKATESGGGSILALHDQVGNRTLEIDGSQGVAKAGAITFKKTNGTTTMLIEGEDASTGTGGGAMTLSNDVGTTTATLRSTATVGGTLTLYNTSGDQTVSMQGHEQGGGSRMRLKNAAGISTVDVDPQSTDGHATMILSDANLSPTIELDAWDTSDGGSAIRLRNGTSIVTTEIDAAEPDGGGNISLYNGVGTETIQIDADYGGSGNSRIITDVIQIEGGSDLSEQFDIGSSPEIRPGMIVSIDPSNPGRLSISDTEYDRRVAGVISGAGGVRPGMLMGQHGTTADGEHAVALTGRVYAYADASYGPIESGDLLTTSRTPGYARKVTDHDRAQGAILGKAMTPLVDGRGLVLVLVTLQ